MFKRSFLWLFCATLLSCPPAMAQAELTLHDTITTALARSPRLHASESRIAAAEGELRQAGAWSNPELGIEAENVAGRGAYKGFDAAEITYGVTQELPLSGKRSARTGIAGKEAEIAALEAQAEALDVIRDVSIAYADAVAAEELVRLASEQKALAGDVLRSVSARVGAAAAPLIQKSRAQVEHATARVAFDKAQRERDTTRARLAACMGGERATLPLSLADFYTLGTPSFEPTDDRLEDNPDLAKLTPGLARSKARLALEQANALPDPRVNVGVRDLRESGDQAFVVGLSLPIPVLDANRGTIDKARAEVNRTEFEARQAMIDARAALTDTQARMQNAYLQADTLEREILPAAERAFSLAREGYGLGRFPYLEVLDAQRSLFEVKQQRIGAIREFHTAQAQLDRLIAAHRGELNIAGATHAE